MAGAGCSLLPEGSAGGWGPGAGLGGLAKGLGGLVGWGRAGWLGIVDRGWLRLGCGNSLERLWLEHVEAVWLEVNVLERLAAGTWLERPGKVGWRLVGEAWLDRR